MGLSPTALKILAASIPLLIDRLVVLRSMMCLGQEFRRRASLCSILISWPRNLLPWPLNVTIISKPHIGLLWSKSDHGKLSCASRSTYHPRLDCLRLVRMNTKLPRAVAVHNVAVMT